MLSYRQYDLNGANTIIIQMSSCSFDEHTQQCMGSVILGATLVLLRPHGNLDTRYLCQTIARNQATLIDLVPTSLSILCDYLNSISDSGISKCLATLKLITVGGKWRYFIVEREKN
jgi:non-ribosomal peptide synthetase component F